MSLWASTDGTAAKPRTLAEKLRWARDAGTAPGQRPPSYEALAGRVAEATGVRISGAHLRELATGRATAPAPHQLRALADYFALPVDYLANDAPDAATETGLDAGLGLGTATRAGTATATATEAGLLADVDADAGARVGKEAAPDAAGPERGAPGPALAALPGPHGVREVRLREPADERADPDTLRRVLRGLRLLPDPDGHGPAAAPPPGGPDAERRRLLAEVAAEPGLLDALSDAETRAITAEVGALSAESRSTLLPLITRLREIEARGE
ncbi:hypothetical protein RM844_10520 [Streptomyces sp. DSM 44915]|uniref:XRE family transcriptional regulator n=1 Tax=Streptomyces chisholmiae TaxID=3075540 RepID=A0ABU2JP06_9ACTN|nr:hypothetical protein [Streptomyces sp. DSM 44915]MDT0266727.1 hypothetical protein [Streptomyces sp. DSM 44915]